MSFFDTLQEATQQERHELFNLPIIVDALEGKVSLESYRAFLAQAYYHVRHTVPLMMACGARLPSRLGASLRDARRGALHAAALGHAAGRIHALRRLGR